MKDYQYYWKLLTQTHTTWLHSDSLEIVDGHAIFKNAKGTILNCFAPSQWTSVHAASVFDGAPINIEHLESAQETFQRAEKEKKVSKTVKKIDGKK